MKSKEKATAAASGSSTTIVLKANMYVSYCNSASRDGKATTNGGSQASLYANGTMQAILFIPYTYETDDPTKIPTQGKEEAAAEAIDADVTKRFFNNGGKGELEIVTVTNNGHILDGGWKIALSTTSSRYIHDLRAPTGVKPKTLWKVNTGRTTFEVNGVYVVYAAAPKSLAGYNVDLKARYIPEVGDQYTTPVTLSFSTFSISKDNLELKKLESRGTSGAFQKLYVLCYKSGAVAETVRLHGISTTGKNGILLGASGNASNANMLLTYIEDNDARIAAFWDGTHSTDRSKIALGIYADGLKGTKFASGTPATNGYYCDGGSWYEVHNLNSGLVASAFSQGIPMAFVRKKDGYKLRQDTIKGQRIILKDKESTVHAYDNCGNKISMTISWHKYDWNNAPNWDGSNGKMPVVIESATHLPDGMGSELPT